MNIIAEKCLNTRILFDLYETDFKVDDYEVLVVIAVLPLSSGRVTHMGAFSLQNLFVAFF